MKIAFALMLTLLAASGSRAFNDRNETGQKKVKSPQISDRGQEIPTSGGENWTWINRWAASAAEPTGDTTSKFATEIGHTENHVVRRARRAVDLRTLRRLMTNIALSEYYRLRGLEVLGSLGMGHGKPGGVPSSVASAVVSEAPSSDTETSASSPKVTRVGAGSYFDFPLRPDEFQQFFGTLGRSPFSRRG